MNSPKRRLYIRMSCEEIEKHLFDNKARIHHIEHDHDTDTVKIILDGVGPTIVVEQTVVRETLWAALMSIREAIHRE